MSFCIEMRDYGRSATGKFNAKNYCLYLLIIAIKQRRYARVEYYLEISTSEDNLEKITQYVNLLIN